MRRYISPKGTAETPAFHRVTARSSQPQMFNRPPLKKELSGLKLEYPIVQLYSRDAGKREAKIAFNVGQGTQDLGFRNEVDVLFNCIKCTEVTFQVRDENHQPTTASFIIRDQEGRVYPPPP